MRFCRNHVRHFTPMQFIFSWLGGVPFENGLVSHAYVRFVEACKRDYGIVLHAKTRLVCEKFATLSYVCYYVQNKSDGSSYMQKRLCSHLRR